MYNKGLRNQYYFKLNFSINKLNVVEDIIPCLDKSITCKHAYCRIYQVPSIETYQINLNSIINQDIKYILPHEYEFGYVKEHGKASRMNIFLTGRYALRQSLLEAIRNIDRVFTNKKDILTNNKDMLSNSKDMLSNNKDILTNIVLNEPILTNSLGLNYYLILEQFIYMFYIY